MPIIKIFPSTDEEKKEDPHPQVADAICTYFISVLWNNPAGCNLFQLAGQLSGSKLHPLITTMIADTDGEITIQIGQFVKGTVINLFFGVQAITDIANLKMIITNANDRTSIRVLPKNDGEVKKMAKGEIYNDQILNYALH